MIFYFQQDSSHNIKQFIHSHYLALQQGPNHNTVSLPAQQIVSNLQAVRRKIMTYERESGQMIWNTKANLKSSEAFENALRHASN